MAVTHRAITGQGGNIVFSSSKIIALFTTIVSHAHTRQEKRMKLKEGIIAESGLLTETTRAPFEAVYQSF